MALLGQALSTTRIQAGLALAIALVYAGAFVPLREAAGPGISGLVSLPVVLTGWFFGLRAGLLAAVLALPLNTLLFNLAGVSGWDAALRAGGVPGLVILAVVAGAIGQLRDLREQLQRELAKREQTEAALIQAQAATEAARQADRLKGEFVSTVSHELRTPLTSLLGFSELMLHRKPRADQVEQFATVMHLEAQRLRDVIDDLLDLQRLEAGRETFAFEPVELASVVERTVRVYQGEAQQHTLVAKLPAGLPAVRADAPKLLQGLANLVSNAIKYSPDGGEIRIGAWQEDGAIHVTVSDEGLGIPAEALERIFERFYRVRTTTHEQVRGTGLGLALTREVMVAHEGQVWAESAGAGQGSTFHFTLPVAQSAPS
ncbi:MAG: hypothetical protein CL878_07825 [Dehalococcoidia bacterium]|nr:hypothetical protein [Dehalococcoidia bacterium]